MLASGISPHSPGRATPGHNSNNSCGVVASSSVTTTTADVAATTGSVAVMASPSATPIVANNNCASPTHVQVALNIKTEAVSVKNV